MAVLAPPMYHTVEKRHLILGVFFLIFLLYLKRVKFINIQKIFNEDIRDKKRIGRGAFSKRGKGVKHVIRGIKTPYDFMKTKERKKLNGECVISNMYDEIITRSEFDTKDTETQKRLLIRWRELYSNKEIMLKMGITASGTFSKYINELKIPKKSSKKAKANYLAPSKQVEAVTQLLNTGLRLEYNGTYNSEQLGKILTKLQLLIENEENDFVVNISLIER